MTDPVPAHGCMIDGQPAMPILISEYNALVTRAASAETAAQRMTSIQGRCPACGWASLFLGDGGHVTCSRLECPNPSAADDLLHATPGPEATQATEPGPAWTPPPPGDRREQLPDEVLAAIRPGPYLSTACHAAFLCETSEPVDALEGWPQRLHARCRINNKFTGRRCACGCHTAAKET